MNPTTIAIGVDLAGWVMWFALTRLLAQGAVEKWITVDYYASTVLLTLSTLCTVAGAFLGDPVLVTQISVPLLIIGLGILAWRSLGAGGRATRMQYAAAAATQQQAAAPNRTQAARRDAVKRRSVTIEEIENMEVTA